MSDTSFITKYLDFTGNGEIPTFFNRWTAISGLGAFLGRQYFLNHGHQVLVPNPYCMLVGNPGTRKSSAIKIMKALLQQAGYNTIAAEKTSKEKFLLDLMGEPDMEYDEKGRLVASSKGKSLEDIMDSNLFGGGSNGNDGEHNSEMFVMADEFNDFLGNGNMEFCSLLGSLWDYRGTYRSRIKSGKSVEIKDPTISILAGNTPAGISLCFPQEVIGQGFFSRLILVYAKPNGTRVAFPPPPDEATTAELVLQLREIKSKVKGPAVLMPTSRALLDDIYCSYRGIDDPRFESYCNRRFTHLLKLCLVVSAARHSSIISEDDIVYANTILSFTESLMPKALGEFGKAKNSGAVAKIMQMLDNTNVGLGLPQLWRGVSSDLDSIKALGEILANLLTAGKIQQVKDGYLPMKEVFSERDSKYFDGSLITDEEKDIAK